MTAARTQTEIAAWNEELGRRYRECESDICDLRLRGIVLEAFFSETIRETEGAPKFGKNVTIILTREQIEALEFLISQQQTQVLALHRRFYADVEDEQ
ncbi:hypothetical protein ASG32_30940 [Methylobacterium sp. Leaf361]|uniref:hypothetical protein n=1 Tax=Methylobacterium sp. Leaf361 TaxID=1736352 RepID=UPI00070107CB|nr:hypothetical protein [Methylobacterium sp. Leaf361]KQS65951.1 hypothetical protein ASG32_30940 [Methylobacterium sp. Leaf361]